jgi:hypothetical protein
MRSTSPRRCRPNITNADATWNTWQQEIVTLLHQELSAILGPVGLTDVDWPAWRPLYEQGHSAKAALDRAFERDV